MKKNDPANDGGAAADADRSDPVQSVRTSDPVCGRGQSDAGFHSGDDADFGRTARHPVLYAGTGAARAESLPEALAACHCLFFWGLESAAFLWIAMKLTASGLFPLCEAHAADRYQILPIFACFISGALVLIWLLSEWLREKRTARLYGGEDDPAD